MMRDWANTLLPASYNGVSFHVDGEDLGGGRRLAIHQTAGGEVPVIEDMGRATSTFNVTAYLAGDLADVQANGLIAMAGLPGPGFLVLPIDGPQMVHVTEDGFRRSRSKDRNGYVAVDLTFIAAGIVGGYSLGLGDVGFAVTVNLGPATLDFAGLF
jgi:prophage DNA circulation protein